MTDKTPGACQCHEKHAPTYWKGVVREYKHALEKAVRERDEALADAEPRPLTPDAITDEMVERARNVQSFEGRLSPTPRLVREMLTAALTEPPARPEGAEGIEAAFDTWEHAEYLNGAIDAYDKRALADHIAEEMSR